MKDSLLVLVILPACSASNNSEKESGKPTTKHSSNYAKNYENIFGKRKDIAQA